MHGRHSSSALAAHWRSEVLRTNLWLVPGVEVLMAIALFAVTLGLDRAAYRGDFGLPSWVISGTADAARQILTAIAAAVITVVGVVFSITWSPSRWPPPSSGRGCCARSSATAARS